MTLHWLSFADPDRPKGAQFLGVAIVEALDFAMAVTSAHLRMINPGGEVQGEEVDDECVALIPPAYQGRLLTRDECEAVVLLMRGVKPA